MSKAKITATASEQNPTTRAPFTVVPERRNDGAKGEWTLRMAAPTNSRKSAAAKH